MKRKCFAAMLSALLLLTLCTPFAASALTQQTRYEMRHDLSIYFTNADELVHQIREIIKRRDAHFEIAYTSHSNNMDDLSCVVRELMAEVFAETDDPTEGDYLYHHYGGYDLTYSYVQDEERYHYTLTVTPEYLTDAGQEQAVTVRVQEILAALHFTRRTTDAEKIAAVYDWMCSHVQFDRIHRNNAGHHLKATAYGALVYGYAVCQGYAAAMYRLLRESGVNCRIITGTATRADGSTEYHAWNIAEIDGLWYNLDPTWDAQSGTDIYFLRCDAHFNGHERDSAYADDAFYTAYPMAQMDYVRKDESYEKW